METPSLPFPTFSVHLTECSGASSLAGTSSSLSHPSIGSRHLSLNIPLKTDPSFHSLATTCSLGLHRLTQVLGWLEENAPGQDMSLPQRALPLHSESHHRVAPAWPLDAEVETTPLLQHPLLASFTIRAQPSFCSALDLPSACFSSGSPPTLAPTPGLLCLTHCWVCSA